MVLLFRYPLPSPDGSDRRRHSRNSSISSTGNPITNAMSGIASSMSSFSNSLGFAGHSNVDGFPTPMINRRTGIGSSKRNKTKKKDKILKFCDAFFYTKKYIIKIGYNIKAMRYKMKVSVISSEPAKKAMPDLQRFPWNLYLINNVENMSGFFA